MNHVSSHHHHCHLDGAWVEADNEEGTEPVEGGAKGGSNVLMMFMLKLLMTMTMIKITMMMMMVLYTLQQ